MFYVKKKLSKGVEINVDIEYDNVYTRCPECGVEHMIDISKFANEDFDIESTRVYYEKCSVNLRNNTERRNIKCRQV